MLGLLRHVLVACLLLFAIMLCSSNYLFSSQFLEKDEGILWVKKNRLSLFLRSEICAEYKLARSLSNAQVCVFYPPT